MCHLLDGDPSPDEGGIASSASNTIPVTYSGYLRPVTYSEYLKPMTYSEHLRPVTYSEHLRPLTYSEYLRRMTFSEYLRPVTDTEYLRPVTDLDFSQTDNEYSKSYKRGPGGIHAKSKGNGSYLPCPNLGGIC